MKRRNNIYQEMCSIENIHAAEATARKGKEDQYGVKAFDKNKDANILKIHDMLINKTFTTSPYTTIIIKEPKEREIFRLPYFPDRIIHHVVMRPLEALFVSTFTTDTYACIKKRGTHAAVNAVKKALRNVPATTYCLKLDFKKFYPNVDHGILKQLLRRKIKDNDLLWLLDSIIDSAPGLPIGNYLSQYFSNFYVTYFDHWLKETKRVKYYFRYVDDLVILSDSKEYLHNLLADIKQYVSHNLKVTVKGNYQVFPVATRGIDFVGYKFFHTHTLLRKSIKKNFARMLVRRNNPASVASYLGWVKHCNSKNLLKKLLNA